MKRLYKYLYFCTPRLRFLKQVEGRHYLDFGCGDGVALRQNLIVRPDLNCFAMDVKDFQKQLPPDVVFNVYDGINIPFNSEQFDIITANHVLEHVHKPDKILLELKRILKPNGQVFIEVPNERSLRGKPSSNFAGTVHFHDDPTHIRAYSRAELIQLCQQLGFSIVKVGISRNLLHLILSPVLF